MFTLEARVEPGIPPYHPMSVRKVVLLSVCTFSAYQIHWFYRNWWAARLRTGARVNPLRRTLFFPVTCYSLFRRIRASAVDRSVESGFKPILSGLLCSVFALFWRLDETFWPTVLLTIVPLVAAQREINRIGQIVTPGIEPEDTYSNWEKLLVGAGGLAFVLALVGTIYVL